MRKLNPRLHYLLYLGASTYLLLAWSLRSHSDILVPEGSSEILSLGPPFAPGPTNANATVLWLITCETRTESPSLWQWHKSAYRFRATDKQHAHNIKIVNVCEGISWDGYMTKIQVLQDLAEKIIQTSRAKGDKNRNKNRKGETNILMFTDSDTYFNAYAVDFNTVIKRYDTARKGRPILVSAEPCCYIGQTCDNNDLLELYPAATTRSSCPQFLNSGQYMGSAEAILFMLKRLFHMKKHMNDIANDNDQYRMALFLAENPELIALDTRASLFRSMMFGLIDGNKQVPAGVEGRTCGMGAVKACGEYDNPYVGTLNEITKHIEMQVVPGCHNEITPFSLHFAGPRKKLKLASEMDIF